MGPASAEQPMAVTPSELQRASGAGAPAGMDLVGGLPTGGQATVPNLPVLAPNAVDPLNAPAATNQGSSLPDDQDVGRTPASPEFAHESELLHPPIEASGYGSEGSQPAVATP